MAVASTVGYALDLKGDRELVRALLNLDKAVFNRVTARATRRAMAPTVRAAKAGVRVEYGFLKKSIGVRVKRYPRKGITLVVVGSRGGFRDEGTGRDPAFYSHLVEGGHRIVRRGSLRRRRKRQGYGFTTVRGSGQMLGRVRAYPFLVPALEQQADSTVSILKRELAAGVEREAKIAAKGAR